MSYESLGPFTDQDENWRSMRQVGSLLVIIFGAVGVVLGTIRAHHSEERFKSWENGLHNHLLPKAAVIMGLTRSNNAAVFDLIGSGGIRYTLTCDMGDSETPPKCN